MIRVTGYIIAGVGAAVIALGLAVLLLWGMAWVAQAGWNGSLAQHGAPSVTTKEAFSAGWLLLILRSFLLSSPLKYDPAGSAKK